jgi:transcription-repair coupling factor (superfamily II helicase)
MPGVHIEFLRGGTSQSAEGRRVRYAIGNGTAAVVVGTHALLSKTVSFKRLELLVVDEEQRFGVAQKERLKAMATGVDVLTLTATPIPRTLQMSLSGIRDLSTLRTAPPGRKEIETHVLKFEDDLVKSVIEREMERGGQTFFVVPRIAHIERSIRKINELVPEARVSVAHGRLKDVEDRIIDFADGNSDVLVATSVVESGLDLPNANTIVVTDPQIFGLSALYQLRGRVGRSARLAYAYFMYPANTPMTGE